MGLKDKLVLWFVRRKLKGSSMLKWFRKYPVLFGVAVVCVATVLRFFGLESWSEMLSGLAQGAGLTLDGVNAPVSTAEVSGAVLGLLGVATKLWRDWQKRKVAR